MNSILISENTDYWIITVEDMIVSQIRLDYAFSLEFWGMDQSTFILRIEKEFVFVKGEESYLLSAMIGTGMIYPALDVLHQALRSIKIFKSSNRLEVVFVKGMQIQVETDQSFEAWTLTGSDFIFVGTPGK